MKKLICTIFILLFMIGCASNRNYGSISDNINVGPNIDENVYTINIGTRHINNISKHWAFDQEIDVGVIYSGGCNQEIDVGVIYYNDINSRLGFRFLMSDFNPTINSRLGLLFLINEDWSIKVAGGPTYIYHGGDVAGLANSSLYANYQIGLRWKNFGLACDHISSPFHKADSGDVGINSLKLIVEF